MSLGTEELKNEACITSLLLLSVDASVMLMVNSLYVERNKIVIRFSAEDYVYVLRLADLLAICGIWNRRLLCQHASCTFVLVNKIKIVLLEVNCTDFLLLVELRFREAK